MEKLLIVEDDIEFSRTLGETLRSHGWMVEIANNGSDGLQFLTNFSFDLVLLDWELPDMTGIEICRKFRSTGGNTPILFVTGRKSIDDRESGLDAGGDDYIIKPFDIRELLARIRAIQRRPRTVNREPLRIADLEFDPQLRMVKRGNAQAHLSFIEGNILEYFLRHRNSYFSAAQLFEALWPADTDSSAQTVKVHMGLLRKRLATVGVEDLITTVKGAGYILKDGTSG